MKKAIAVAGIIILILLTLTGCATIKTGNRIVGGKDVQTFTYAYVRLGEKDIAEGFVTQWREQKCGRWEPLTGMAPPEYHGHKICSICECFAPYDPLHVGREKLSPYCPGCGAKMEVTLDA